MKHHYYRDNVFTAVVCKDSLGTADSLIPFNREPCFASLFNIVKREGAKADISV